MNPKLEGLPREYQRIQSHWRISVPKRFREALGWKKGDQVLIEVIKGKLLVENLSAKWRADK